MAEIAAVLQSTIANPVRRTLWETMGDDDEGAAINVSGNADGSVQAVGTWGGATLNLQGSNDGTNWFNLTDEAGDDIALTADGGDIFVPRTWKIRPVTSGGSGTDVDVTTTIR